MPRHKKSQGKVKFRTVFPEEFQRWLMYELANVRQWNPLLVQGGMTGFRQWKYETTQSGETGWSIQFDGEAIIIESEMSVINLRKGLNISMGQGTIIIGSSVA